MSKRISVKDAEMLKRNRYILQKLLKANNADRRKILSNAPSELFQVMNLIFRVLNDTNIRLSNKNENKIKKHRRFIQNTSDLKASAIKRKLKAIVYIWAIVVNFIKLCLITSHMT